MAHNVLTCVYCGMAYPEGTPPAGAQILTDHIKVCPKHPLRAAEAKIATLRSALEGLMGGPSSKEELEQMEVALRTLNFAAPDKDKVAAINAIHALLDTMEA